MPPAKRRSSHSGGPTSRDRILDAALRLFAKRGFDATTTKAIAEEAQVAYGSVFYHFSTKQELLETLLAERSFAPQLQDILTDAEPADPVATLLHIGERFEALLVNHGDFVRVLLTTAAPGTATLERFQDLLHAQFTSMSDYLLQAIGSDRLPPRRARTIARSYMATIVFTTLIAGTRQREPDFLDDTIHALLDPYLDQPTVPAG